jgi:3-oxoisoapionate decarboxylase
MGTWEMKRRDFSKIAGMSLLALYTTPAFPSSMLSKNLQLATSRIPLGLCNHSLRSMDLNAQQLIEYAIEHKLDSVLFNTLEVFQSLKESHLTELGNLTKANDISIYVGVGGISEKSGTFSDSYGNAEELLDLGIRVASLVGSPVVGCRIGDINDRYSEGGIEAKIEEVVKLMNEKRGPVLDAGIKFAFENHAGDLRSEELVDLIEETGTDICGAFFDPGNAVRALEDPMLSLQVLGRHIICNSIRDVMVWETEEGADCQFTAIGEGLMDYKFFAKYMAENCPGVPLHVETISNSLRPIRFLKPGFWEGFPDLPASEIADFLKLIRRGHPLEIAEPPEGTDIRSFEIMSQQSELMKSLEYLRRECGAGLI